jgi:2-oxoglutarate ferredoxin oxidoreductase subunit delta
MPYWRQPLDRDRIRIPKGTIHIIDERCKGCGFCTEFCPQNLLIISERINSKGYHPPEVLPDKDCINCGLCSLLCPDFAIYIEDAGTKAPEKISPISDDEAHR